MLASRGCAVTEATNGREGVERAEQERFDLILIDISMPGMDGLEACRAIRSGEGASRRSPIVGLTAHAMPEERRRYLEAGMNDCLIKPLRRAALDRVLSDYRLPGTAAGPVSEGEATVEEGRPELVDPETFAELREVLPPPVLEKRIAAFSSELDRGLGSVGQALRDGRIAVAEKETHKLAGSAALFGATELRQTLLSLETACREGDAARAEAERERARAILAPTIEALTTLSDLETTSGAP